MKQRSGEYMVQMRSPLCHLSGVGGYLIMSPSFRASMPTIYASVPRGFRSWETFASSFLGRQRLCGG